MTALLTIVHVFVCFVLIAAVLLQSGKAADLAGAFGGAGSQTAFGPRGTATILAKLTTACAILFMFTSLGLWLISSKQSSVVKDVEPGKAKPAASQTQTTKPEAPQPAPQTTQQPAETQKSEPPKK